VVNDPGSLLAHRGATSRGRQPADGTAPTFTPWRPGAAAPGLYVMMQPTWPAFLATRRPLLDAAAACESFDDPATVTRLRKLGDAEAVRRAIDLTLARRKAGAKFDRADALIADAAAVEQATGAAVARHKSRRFAEAGVDAVVDLCCGVGGDAMALADAADVTLIDHDVERVWAARHNVERITGRHCPAAACDAADLRLADRVFHFDPSRRSGGRRLHRYDDYRPGPAFIDALLARCPTGAIKLGPGVDLDALPAGEVELISEAGSLVQAVLWTGRLARHQRSATVLPAGRTLNGSPDAFPPIAPIGDHLLAVDPAVERAGLIAALCDHLGAACVHPALGLLTADRPIASPFVTTYRHLETLPWRPRKIKDWLADHDAGIVTIKTRDKVVDPDRLQADLRSEGATPYTLFILRHDRQVLCHITQPDRS